MRKFFRTALLLLFLIGAAYCGYQIYDILQEYQLGVELYTNVQQHIVLPAVKYSQLEQGITFPETSTSSMPSETTPSAPKPEILFPEVDFPGLLEMSQDVVGWIYIEGTNINYPIVQGFDNRYYVSTLIDGTPNDAGSIFMDFQNTADFSDAHTVLYGHNMKNGTMFHDIVNYQKQEFYDQNSIGLIMTPEKNYYFEIVSAYIASLADPAWQLEFVDEADALQWLQDSIARSSIVGSTQPQPGDRIITLSTCTYEFNDARFVLVGILKEG